MPPKRKINDDTRPIFRQPTSRKLPDGKIFIISDLHGDLELLFRTFLATNLVKVDPTNEKLLQWNYDDKKISYIIQLGDFLDSKRNMDTGNDIDVLNVLINLKATETSTRKLLILLGNHEIMNVTGDFRYVSTSSAKACRGLKERKLLFMPGGEIAKWLAENTQMILTIDRELFVHGGLVDSFVNGVLNGEMNFDELNKNMQLYLWGDVTKTNEVIKYNDATNSLQRLKKQIPEYKDIKIDKSTLDQFCDLPCWTRILGTNKPHPKLYPPQELQIEKITKYYDHIFIGHTIVKDAEIALNGHVIKLDTGAAVCFHTTKKPNPVWIAEIFEKNIKLIKIDKFGKFIDFISLEKKESQKIQETIHKKEETISFTKWLLSFL
jgi:hypothetical protein